MKRDSTAAYISGEDGSAARPTVKAATGANVNAKRTSNIESDDREQAERLLSTKEAATILGLSPSTLHTWRSTGHVRLPHVRLGRAVRYPERGLLDFLARAATS